MIIESTAILPRKSDAVEFLKVANVLALGPLGLILSVYYYGPSRRRLPGDAATASRLS